MTNEQLCALAKQGDADAQNLLIENNLRFIKKTAHEVWSAQAEPNRALRIALDDLAQEDSFFGVHLHRKLQSEQRKLVPDLCCSCGTERRD